MKGGFYFKHDLDTREDDKMRPLIMKHGARGTGVYWWIVEDLYRNNGRLPRDYPALAWAYREPENIVKSIVEDFSAFYDADGRIACRRVDRDLAARREALSQASAAGKASAAKRALNGRSTTVQPGEERRGEERKERTRSAGADGASDSSFDSFWKAYPKKVGKGAAERLWKRQRPSQELQARIMAAVSVQAACEQWRREDGRFIPNPATWLNQGRWDDESTAGTVAASNVPGKRPWACDWCGSKTNPKGAGWGGAICEPCEKEDAAAGGVNP